MFAQASTACHCKTPYSSSAWKKTTAENAEGPVASEPIDNDTLLQLEWFWHFGGPKLFSVEKWAFPKTTESL